MSKTGETKLPPKVQEAIDRVGKEQVRKLTVIVSEKDEAVGYCYLPEALPNKLRSIYSRTMAAYRNGSGFDAGEIILSETWIDGDHRMRDNTSKVYMSACQQASDLVDFLPTAITTI